MNALDSSYEWGVNPLKGSLSPQQRTGLASLAPQAGYGLARPTTPQLLDPSSRFPTPQYSSQITDYNNAERDISNQIQQAEDAWAGGNHFGGLTQEQFNDYLNQLGGEATAVQGPFAWAANNNGVPGAAPEINLQSNGKPQFDPNYPNESMLALKNWLAPQLENTAARSLNANGLGYSGVKDYAFNDLRNEMNQLSPEGVGAPQALANDFSWNYGPGIANELISRGQLPGAAPIGNGDTGGSDAQLVLNRAAQDPAHPSPLYSVMAGGTMYPSAGYFYDAAQQRDASRYPWLASVSSQTSPTSGQAA